MEPLSHPEPLSRPEPLGALLEGGADAPALVVAEDGGTLSYGQLADRVQTLAGRLAAAGVRRGDRVALSLRGGPEYIQLFLAITALGAAAAPLNPAYTEAEFTFYLTDIAPRFLLVSGIEAATGAAAGCSVPVLMVQARDDGLPGLFFEDAEISSVASAESGRPDDVGVVLHTSGTTSRPKQVPLLQRNLMASARTIAWHYRLGPADVSFCAMPLFHVHGLVASTFATLGSGGSVVVPRRFTPQRFWRQAREHRATWLSAGPTLHQMILDAGEGVGQTAPETLRFARSCSSALAPALLHRGEQAYGVPMLEAYGMTEASHQMSSNPLPPAARIPGSVGVPTGTQIGVADRGGTLLGEGQVGEVVIRGPGVTSGYVASPAATAEAFYGDWFRTGDLGVLRDGYLYLEGRIKEMIIRGGENVSPIEIEQVLLAHPAVRDAVCFGVSDDKYGELVGAAVTLKAPADAKELTDHCRTQLAPFKVPASIRILDQIPRTATGKVQRRRVAEYIEGLGG